MTEAGRLRSHGDGGGPRFADGKDDSALRTIGEVAAALGIRQHVLRYWEEQFPMLRPLKRSGGRRYYRPADVALVEAIDRLVHREGYTLRGARKALADGTARFAAGPLHDPAQLAAPAREAPAAAGGAGPALRERLLAVRAALANALHEA